MTIYKFIECAQTMRNGGTCVVGCPPRYGKIKASYIRHKKLNDAYSALWGFRIKHPDSKRTRRSRTRALALKSARELKGYL